jgi:hypothetical protein
VLRCVRVLVRVIQEKAHTEEETTARWYKAINRRLTDDKITATIIKREKPECTSQNEKHQHDHRFIADKDHVVPTSS